MTFPRKIYKTVICPGRQVFGLILTAHGIKANLLPTSLPSQASYSEAQWIFREVAGERVSGEKNTAAGLSGIFTPFPFNRAVGNDVEPFSDAKLIKKTLFCIVNFAKP